MQDRQRKGNSLYQGSFKTSGEVTKHKEIRIERKMKEEGGMEDERKEKGKNVGKVVRKDAGEKIEGDMN
jgi:hypothetical protein